MDDKENRIDSELSKLSPFELKNRIIALADESVKKDAHVMLNAGRGNPNWIAPEPREAFIALSSFAIGECRRVMDLPDGIAGIPEKEGIASRFEQYLKDNVSLPGVPLLKRVYSYMLMQHAVDPDSLVHEWAEGVTGDQYPVPPRILQYTQMIVRDYLDMSMCDNRPPEGEYDLFATEGGTAGMCYVFDSLQQNFLLNRGDSVALMVPVFTPYIEIPRLDRFSYDVLNICAGSLDSDGIHTWQYKVEDIYKLRDPKYKVLFVTNPSNPPSYALGSDVIDAIKDVVQNSNPDLMIITDDVYGTFGSGFRSLMAELPHNTVCVYSFSKYFGATGWRTAVVALHQDNVFDRMIAALPDSRKAVLENRYSSLTVDVPGLRFIDRMVADSRDVALNHTAGLSLPQQTQMSFFAAFALIDSIENGGRYQKAMIDLIQRRLHALWESTGFTLKPDPLRAGYYSEIDMLVWARKFYGVEFVDYLKANYNPLDVVFRLARECGQVVLNGGGFDGPKWSVRVSLANLDEDAYVKIGKGIRSLLDSYAAEWKGGKG